MGLQEGCRNSGNVTLLRLLVLGVQIVLAGVTQGLRQVPLIQGRMIVNGSEQDSLFAWCCLAGPLEIWGLVVSRCRQLEAVTAGAACITCLTEPKSPGVGWGPSPALPAAVSCPLHQLQPPMLLPLLPLPPGLSQGPLSSTPRGRCLSLSCQNSEKDTQGSLIFTH